MDWTELTLAVKAEDTGPACDIVALVSPDGFYLEDYSDLEAGAREIAAQTLHAPRGRKREKRDPRHRRNRA